MGPAMGPVMGPAMGTEGSRSTEGKAETTAIPSTTTSLDSTNQFQLVLVAFRRV